MIRAKEGSWQGGKAAAAGWITATASLPSCPQKGQVQYGDGRLTDGKARRGQNGRKFESGERYADHDIRGRDVGRETRLS